MNLVGVDFFCGIGGATKGFQNAGINVIRGIDNDITCKETYEKNCVPSKFVLSDMHTVSPKNLLHKNEFSNSDYLIFIACAPCQPFSRSYKKETGADKRKNLILRFLNFVEEFRPDFIFVENVPGFEKAESGNISSSFVSKLESKDLNYEVTCKSVDAKIYGVPQTRSRYIMIASRHGKIDFPSPTHGKKLLNFLTVRDCISKYPPISAGNTCSEVPNHVTRSLSDLNLRRIRNTPKDGGSRASWSLDLWLECHKKQHSGHSDVYGRMSWDKPAPTLTCRCNSITNGRFGHPSQDRAISLREAASLQTFEDDFVFYGDASNIARHIGNAVPPLIARIFAKAIITHILNHPSD